MYSKKFYIAVGIASVVLTRLCVSYLNRREEKRMRKATKEQIKCTRTVPFDALPSQKI